MNKKFTTLLLISPIISSCNMSNDFSRKMDHEDITQKKISAKQEDFNRSFIKILKDDNLSKIFSVIDGRRHNQPNFINEWDAREKESSKAFIAALNFAIDNVNEPLSLELIRYIRKNLLQKSLGEYYEYIQESNWSVSNAQKSDTFAYRVTFGIPNVADFLLCFNRFFIDSKKRKTIIPKLYCILVEHSKQWVLGNLINTIEEFYPNIMDELSMILDEHETLYNDEQKNIGEKKSDYELVEALEKEFLNKLCDKNIINAPQKFADITIENYPKLALSNVKLYSNPSTAIENHLQLEILNISAERYDTFKIFIDTYESEMKSHESMTDDQKYFEILMLVKSMEMCHWFRDFNIRTWYTIMLKEFIRFDLPATMFYNPNWIDILSVDFLTKLCKSGVKYIENLVCHGRIDNTWAEGVGTYKYGTTPAPVVEPPKEAVSNIKIEFMDFDFSSVNLIENKIIKLSLEDKLKDEQITINNSLVNKESPIFIDFNGSQNEHVKKICFKDISYVYYLENLGVHLKDSQCLQFITSNSTIPGFGASKYRKLVSEIILENTNIDSEFTFINISVESIRHYQKYFGIKELENSIILKPLEDDQSEGKVYELIIKEGSECTKFIKGEYTAESDNEHYQHICKFVPVIIDSDKKQF